MKKTGMQYVIEDTKTSSGTRMLPMTDEVYECFERREAFPRFKCAEH